MILCEIFQKDYKDLDKKESKLSLAVKSFLKVIYTSIVCISAIVAVLFISCLAAITMLCLFAVIVGLGQHHHHEHGH